MQKIKFFTLAILAMLSVNLAWGESFVINTTNFTAPNSGSGYAAYNGTRTISDIDITSNKAMVQSGKLQFQKASDCYLFNADAMPGNITKITLSTPSNFTIYVGTSSHPTSGSVTSGSTISGSNKYFTVKGSSSATATTATITVEYTSAASTYTVSYELGGGTHGTNHPTSGTIGTAFAVSAPTRSNYTFTGWTVTSGLNTTTAKWGTTSSPSTSLSSSSTKCVNGTSDVYFKDLGSANGSVTLTANWQEKAKYTVTFNAGSGTCSTSSSTESTAGAGVNLPVASPSSACGTDGWTFAGWATASQAETTTAPTLYAASSNYKPSSNCTLYAVYSKTESGGGGTPTLTKMAKGGTLANGDKIVIVANGTTVAMYQETVSSSYVNKWTFDNDIETVVADDKNWLTVTATTDGFTLGDATNGYIYNSGNSLYCGETTVDWELEDLDDGTFKLTTDDRYLSYRSDLTNKYWRMGGASGGTSGQTVLDIYKISASSGTTTYNSNPSCAACTNKITITKGTPSHGSFTLTGAGTDICADQPVTVTLSNITADTHYHATAVTTSAASGGGTPSAISAGSASVTGITASTTINVTFAEDTKVVVTLLNNNAPVEDSDLGFGADGKKEYYTGETLGALPTLTSTDACDATSVTFMGWTTEQITTKRAAAPVFVDADTQVNAAMTLRAVWARAQ